MTDRLSAGETAEHVLASFREQITGLDLRLLATINERIEKVQALRRHKAEHGLAFLDPDREAALVAHLRAANEGPLSDRGLEELFAFVLALVKRELRDG